VCYILLYVGATSCRSSSSSTYILSSSTYILRLQTTLYSVGCQFTEPLKPSNVETWIHNNVTESKKRELYFFSENEIDQGSWGGRGVDLFVHLITQASRAGAASARDGATISATLVSVRLWTKSFLSSVPQYTLPRTAELYRLPVDMWESSSTCLFRTTHKSRHLDSRESRLSSSTYLPRVVTLVIYLPTLSRDSRDPPVYSGRLTRVVISWVTTLVVYLPVYSTRVLPMPYLLVI